MKIIKTVLLTTLIAISSFSIAQAKETNPSFDNSSEFSLFKNMNREGVVIEGGIIRHIKSGINGLTMTVTDTFLGEMKVIRFNEHGHTENTYYFETKGAALIEQDLGVSLEHSSPAATTKAGGCGSKSIALIAAINAREAAVAGGDQPSIEAANHALQAAVSAYIGCVLQ